MIRRHRRSAADAFAQLFGVSLLGIAAAIVLPSPTFAAGFPERDITFVIPNQVGGGFDAYVRAIAPAMEKYLPNKVNVVPLNVPAGGGAKGVSQPLSGAARRLHHRDHEHLRACSSCRSAAAATTSTSSPGLRGSARMPTASRSRSTRRIKSVADLRGGSLQDAAGQVHHHRARRHRLRGDDDRDRTARHQAAAHLPATRARPNTWRRRCAATATPSSPTCRSCRVSRRASRCG